MVQLSKLQGGPEVFALSALMVLLGAIWLVMYNSDLLIRGVMFFTARVGNLAPVTRTSMAYPMATKFRTVDGGGDVRDRDLHDRLHVHV